MKQWTLSAEICTILSTIIFRVGQGGEGGSGIPVYPKNIRQNTQKHPKFIQIYAKLYPGILYTWNSKKVIYRIPVFKLQYTKPLYTVYPKTLADPISCSGFTALIFPLL